MILISVRHSKLPFTPKNRSFVANCGAKGAGVIVYNCQQELTSSVLHNKERGIYNMSIGVLLLKAQEVINAISEMNQAAETYNEAVDACKNAAAELASKWEGEGKEAFVTHEENAYTWHKEILQVVRDMISIINEALEQYRSMEDEALKIVSAQ